MRNGVKTAADSKLTGVGRQEGAPEAMAGSRLGAGKLRRKRENERRKKTMATLARRVLWRTPGLLRRTRNFPGGIDARHKWRHPTTTGSRHGLPVAEKLLARNFTPTAPNPVWTSDITDLRADAGWLSLTLVPDLCNREEQMHGFRHAMHAKIKAAAVGCIEVFHNRKQQPSTFGYRSPVQFLENRIREQHQKKTGRRQAILWQTKHRGKLRPGPPAASAARLA